MADYSGQNTQEEELRYLKSIQAGTAKTNSVAPKFVPDYTTAGSTAKSMIQDPQIDFSEKLPSLDYLQSIKQKKAEIDNLKKEKETYDLDNLSKNYDLYKTQAEGMGLPVPPQPKRLKEYLSAKEKESVMASQALIQERNAADKNVSISEPVKKISAEGQVLNEPFLNALSPGYNQQRNSIDQQAKIAEDKGIQTANYYDGLQQALIENEKTRAAKEAERSEAVNAQILKLDAAKNDYATSKIDPNRLWKRKGTGMQILGALMQGLTVFAAAKYNLANGDAATQIINRAIDQDIDAQKEEISTKKGVVDAENNVYQMMRQRFGDDRLAESATRQILLEGSQLKLASITSKFQGPEAKAKSAQLKGALSVEQQKDAMNFAKISGEVADTKSKAANLNADKLVHGMKQFASTKEAAEKLNSSIETVSAAIEDIRILKDLRKRVGYEPLNTKEASTASAIAANLRVQYKNIAKLGALNESDYGLIDAVIPQDPTKMDLLGTTEAQLTAFEKLMTRGLKHQSISLGVDPSQFLQSLEPAEEKVINGKTYKRVGDNQWEAQVTE